MAHLQRTTTKASLKYSAILFRSKNGADFLCVGLRAIRERRCICWIRHETLIIPVRK